MHFDSDFPPLTARFQPFLLSGYCCLCLGGFWTVFLAMGWDPQTTAARGWTISFDGNPSTNANEGNEAASILLLRGGFFEKVYSGDFFNLIDAGALGRVLPSVILMAVVGTFKGKELTWSLNSGSCAPASSRQLPCCC